MSIKPNRVLDTPLQPSTLYDQLAQQIKVRNAGRNLQPGGKLPNEIELAKE